MSSRPAGSATGGGSAQAAADAGTAPGSCAARLKAV
jgi:hypothetical protein